MKWQILVNGRAVEIDPKHLESVSEAEPGVYSVIVGPDSFEIRLLGGPQGWVAEVNSVKYPVEILDPRNKRRSSREGRGSGRQNIVAPMPGKVIRVLVKAGDQVEMGQGLVVVEAMKMQNEMKAPRPARVLNVLANAGDTIGGGDILVVLE